MIEVMKKRVFKLCILIKLNQCLFFSLCTSASIMNILANVQVIRCHHEHGKEWGMK